MRRLVPVGIVVGLVLAAPVPAQAKPASGQCVCRTWAQQFMRDPGARSAFDQHLVWVISDAKKKRIKQQVYNYAETNAFDEPYCKRHPRICKAALACVIAGGGTYSAARTSGASRKAAGRAGAIACASAAATVMITP